MDEQQILFNMITHPAGFEVGLFGLSLYRLETGGFALYWNRDSTEKVFAKAENAVAAFIKARNQRKLGFDHESGPSERVPKKKRI